MFTRGQKYSTLLYMMRRSATTLPEARKSPTSNQERQKFKQRIRTPKYPKRRRQNGTPLQRRQGSASPMYESNLVYAAWQEGPTTRPINKEQWRGSGGHSTEDRGRNKGTGKGERDGGRRETRGEDMITP